MLPCRPIPLNTFLWRKMTEDQTQNSPDDDSNALDNYLSNNPQLILLGRR